MASLWKACKEGSLEDEKQLIGNINYESVFVGLVLLCAVFCTFLEIVKCLFGHDVDANYGDTSEENALHFAARYGHLEIAKYLVEHGADVNYYYSAEGTALHVAAKHGSFEIVKYLVEHGADINHENKRKETPLHVAAGHGSLQIVKYLVENGADVNRKHTRKGTALHVAASNGFLGIVKYLIEHGADVNGKYTRKGTALHAAASNGSSGIVKYLVKHGADVNITYLWKGTALHVAASNGSLEIVKYLVENGADVNRKYTRKGTALHVAAFNGSLGIFKYLVEHGADVNCKYLWIGTALHVAASNGSLEIVKYLLENGADVNGKYMKKGTALHVAASQGCLGSVKYLVEHGADVNRLYIRKATALHVAVSNGSFEIVKSLVEHGADVNCQYLWKGSALHAAASRGALGIVKYFVKHGADVNRKYKRKGTALHVAASHGSLDIVTYLVEHGADVNFKNWTKRTPLHTAVDSGCLEIIKYMIQHGADTTNVNVHFEYLLLCVACEKGDKLFIDHLLESEIVKNIDKCSDYETSPLSIACSKGYTEIVRTLLKYNVDVRKERKLECKNDEIVNILQLELTKSVKHRDKFQSLRSMCDRQLTKVKPPLRYFEEKQSLSLGVSNATVVYVGIMEDESEVAVKRMFTQSCTDTSENEKKILELINTKKSPFIVNYRHFFRDDTFMYLILDLCEETLRELVHSQSIEYLRQEGPRMIYEILTGLEFLHELGIVHKELKPSNVLVDLDGRMRLADFGICRVLSEDETKDYTDPNETMSWVAAEVIEDIKQKVVGRYKKKSDVQVVGMIAYFILAKGEHLFGHSFERMVNIVNGNAVNLEKLDVDALKFVSWMISKELEDRPYAHEALRHPFLDGIEATLQRPHVVRV